MARSYQETVSVTHGVSDGVHRRPIDPEQANNLKSLRLFAMRLLKILRQIMPANAEKAVPDDGHVKPLPLEYDMLLGRNDGVIDALAKLSRLVMDLIDKERETDDPIQPGFSFTEQDEMELERRIFAELDRVAEQRGAAEGDAEGLPRITEL